MRESQACPSQAVVRFWDWLCEPETASVLSRVILYVNLPLTPSFQRRGTSLTPFLYKGRGGGLAMLSYYYNERDSTLATAQPALQDRGARLASRCVSRQV